MLYIEMLLSKEKLIPCDSAEYVIWRGLCNNHFLLHNVDACERSSVHLLQIVSTKERFMDLKQNAVVIGGKAGGFVKEFRDFAMKGNVVDLAFGVIIGGAFGKIVSSLVSDVLMPVLGLLLGGVNFTEKTFIFRDATIKYGQFLQSVIDFVIVAFAIFLFIKLLNSMRRKHEAAPASATPPADVVLLTEIRDLLKRQQ
jgi:large conductance mechanosensitive channel